MSPHLRHRSSRRLGRIGIGVVAVAFVLTLATPSLTGAAQPEYKPKNPKAACPGNDALRGTAAPAATSSCCTPATTWATAARMTTGSGGSGQ